MGSRVPSLSSRSLALRVAPWLVSACVASALGCGSDPSGPRPPRDVSRLVAEVEEASQGHPRSSTQAATRYLIDALDAREWGYLLSAEWPEDVSAALADPVVQKALATLVPHARPPSRAPVAGKADLAASGPAVIGSADLPSLEAFYQQAREVLAQASGGQARAGSATVVAAVVNGFLSIAKQSGGAPLPAAASPADPATWACSDRFYQGGASTEACDESAFCCGGAIDYGSGGQLECFDATSCKGQGDPPKLNAAAAP